MSIRVAEINVAALFSASSLHNNTQSQHSKFAKEEHASAALIIQITNGAKDDPSSDYTKAEDAFSVKPQKSFLDKQIENRLALEEARVTFKEVIDRLDGDDPSARPTIGEIISAGMGVYGASKAEQGLDKLYDKMIDALAKRALDELDFASRRAFLESWAKIQDQMEKEGVSEGDIERVLDGIKNAVSELGDIELSIEISE